MKIAKWDTFQGYHKTGPTWIKLHASLIDKPEWMRLPIVAKAVLPALWIAASRTGSDGTLPDDVEVLAMLCHLKESEVAEGLPSLIQGGFVECDFFVAGFSEEDSQTLRGGSRLEREEKRREETEKTVSVARARETEVTPEAAAEIDAIRADHAAEEQRLTANLIAIRDAGEDVQAVLDSIAEKGRKPYSAYHWQRTGRSAVPETAQGVTVLRLLNAAIEARQRARDAPIVSDSMAQTMESLRRSGDRIRARLAAEGRKEIA